MAIASLHMTTRLRGEPRLRVDAVPEPYGEAVLTVSDREGYAALSGPVADLRALLAEAAAALDALDAAEAVRPALVVTDLDGGSASITGSEPAEPLEENMAREIWGR